MYSNMPPPSMRPRSHDKIRKEKKSKTVLNEEDYNKVLSSIIERDYFPETKKLKDKLDLLNDLEKNNVPMHIRKKLMDSSNQVNMTSSSSSLASSMFDDDQSQLISVLNPEGHNDDDSDGDESGNYESLPKTTSDHIDIAQMTVDRFFQQYTSQDNESFEALHAQDQAHHRKKYHWAYDNYIEDASDGTASDKQYTIITNSNSKTSGNSNYTNDRRNSTSRDAQLMMYYIGDKVLSESERQKMDNILQGERTVGDNRPSVPESWPCRVRNQLMFPPILSDSEDICRIPEQRDRIQQLRHQQQELLYLTTNKQAKNTAVVETRTESQILLSSSSSSSSPSSTFVSPNQSLPLPLPLSLLHTADTPLDKNTSNSSNSNKRVASEPQRAAKQIRAQNTSLSRQQLVAGEPSHHRHPSHLSHSALKTSLSFFPINNPAMTGNDSSPLEASHTPSVFSDSISLSETSSECNIINDSNNSDNHHESGAAFREYKLISMTPIIVPTGDRKRYIQQNTVNTSAQITNISNTYHSYNARNKAIGPVAASISRRVVGDGKNKVSILEEELVVEEMEPIMTYGELFDVPRILDPPCTSTSSLSTKHSISSSNNSNITVSSTQLPKSLRSQSSEHIYELQPERRRDTLARELDSHWQHRAAVSNDKSNSLYSNQYDRAVSSPSVVMTHHAAITGRNCSGGVIDDSRSVLTRGTSDTGSYTSSHTPRQQRLGSSSASVASIYGSGSIKSSKSNRSTMSSMSMRDKKKELSAAATALVKRLSSSGSGALSRSHNSTSV